MDNRSQLLKISIGSLLLGKPLPCKFKGTVNELKVLTGALMATKEFETVLHKEGATVKEITDALGRKHRAAGQFRRVFRTSWPL